MKIKPKKSLGQHFLQDEKALGQIVAAADLSEDDKVLEIGPGTGALTRYLVSSSSRAIAIEKDSALARELKAKSKKLKVIEGDILGINLPKLIEQNDFFDYKVVANIPYYITGKIIRLLFETKYTPKLIVLLVQKEVAERICAGPGEIISSQEKIVSVSSDAKKIKSNTKGKISRGKQGRMSILAVSVQYFGKPEIISEVSRESFVPAPEVDSAVLKITPFDGQNELKKDSKEFFRLVKTGFSSPRKMLVNNLATGLDMAKQDIKSIFNKLEFDLKIRAEDLTIEQWKALHKEI